MTAHSLTPSARALKPRLRRWAASALLGSAAVAAVAVPAGQVSAERTVLPAYTETSATARVGMTQYLTDDITLDGAGYYERSIFDDDFGTRDFSIAGFTAGAVWDARDNAQDATSGFYLAATAEPFYETMRGYLAFRSTAEARAYWGLMDDRFVLAGRGEIECGEIDLGVPPGQEHVIPLEPLDQVVWHCDVGVPAAPSDTFSQFPRAHEAIRRT